MEGLAEAGRGKDRERACGTVCVSARIFSPCNQSCINVYLFQTVHAVGWIIAARSCVCVCVFVCMCVRASAEVVVCV